MAENNKEVLNKLTDELNMLVADEDLDDEKLREASEGLLPSLCDALHREGYGSRWFKIWSIEHNSWWGPNESGYRQKRSEAGVYDLERATEIVERANIGNGDRPMEALVELVADEASAAY